MNLAWSINENGAEQSKWINMNWVRKLQTATRDS